MSRKLRLGVVGLGMGRGHAEGYKSHPGAELVALCDLDENRLRSAAKQLKVGQTYTDLKSMLEQGDLDAVSIAVPNKLHAPLTIQALGAGLHVLCEKPMATNVKEAEGMQRAAAEAGKSLMINFSFRFTETSHMLKQQVDSGAIGDIYFGRSMWHRYRGMPGNWFADREISGGGPLIDLGVHRLDLALWLMGYPEPVAVSGSTYDYIAREEQVGWGDTYTVEDLACGLIKFANGATLLLEASWALNIKERELMVTTLYGTRGNVEQRNVDGGYQLTGEVLSAENGNIFTKTLARRTAPTPSAYHEFVDSILENRPPLATGEEGVKVMKILEGIYKSAATGCEVRYKK